MCPTAIPFAQHRGAFEGCGEYRSRVSRNVVDRCLGVESNEEALPRKGILKTLIREKMKIELIPATIEQQPILANLLELYAYDFTEFWKFDIGPNGFYGYEDLLLYWKEPSKFPYLIYVDDHIAGFVLVQRGSPISEDKEIYDIAEFFIMRKYRRQNVGTIVALKVWGMFKGPWQVRVLHENKMAASFWLRTIEKFIGHKPLVENMSIEGYNWHVYRFQSLGQD
jgi:predicted acetyltransferase